MAKRVPLADHTTSPDQVTPGWLVTIPLPGEAETTVKLGIGSVSVTWGLAQVAPFGACCLSFFFFFVCLFFNMWNSNCS